MAGRTGYTALTNASPMAGPSQITGVYSFFDSLIGEERNTVALLPSSGNWVGRTIYVRADRTPRVWNGTGWESIGRLRSTDYATGATDGKTLNPGTEYNITFIGKTLPLGGDAMVTASVNIWNNGVNAAGNLSILLGTAIVHSRRWHTHSKASAQMVPSTIAADFVVPASSTGQAIQFLVSSDSSSAGGVELWDAEMKVSIL
jgi:hypothetical protein